MEDFVVAEVVAVSDLKKFVDYHLDDQMEESQVATDYKELVKSVMRGNLNLNDFDAPVLKLRQPIKTEGGTFDKNEIIFKTRITKNQLSAISKGIDVAKDPIGFANRMIVFLTGDDTVSVLDKYGKFDMKVIDQLTGLFL